MNSSSRVFLDKDLNLPKPLRPYQWQGVNFLLNQGSGLVADEMENSEDNSNDIIAKTQALWIRG